MNQLSEGKALLGRPCSSKTGESVLLGWEQSFVLRFLS